MAKVSIFFFRGFLAAPYRHLLETCIAPPARCRQATGLCGSSRLPRRHRMALLLRGPRIRIGEGKEKPRSLADLRGILGEVSFVAAAGITAKQLPDRLTRRSSRIVASLATSFSWIFSAPRAILDSQLRRRRGSQCSPTSVRAARTRRPLKVAACRPCFSAPPIQPAMPQPVILRGQSCALPRPPSAHQSNQSAKRAHQAMRFDGPPIRERRRFHAPIY